MGAKKRPFYRVVVANSTSPRDGRTIDQLGYYDPLTEPATVKIDEQKAILWLQRGAQPSDTAADLLRRAGITERYEEAKKAAKAGGAAGSE
jgi:small subunit ribosomal protein S16